MAERRSVDTAVGDRVEAMVIISAALTLCVRPLELPTVSGVLEDRHSGAWAWGAMGLDLLPAWLALLNILVSERR